MPAIADIFAFIGSHADLLELIFNAITTGKMSKEDLTKAVQDALVAASDLEMKREFPT